MEEAFYNIFMYLYNKNVLEYAQIARNETESRIPYIEGCSTTYLFPYDPERGSCMATLLHIYTTK